MVYSKKKNAFKWMPNTKVVKDRGDISGERRPSALSEEYQVDDYVSKPVSKEILLNVIQGVLE